MHWSGRAPLSLRVWGCADGCGQPGASIAVPTRLDGGAVHPEAEHKLSDEVLCARWLVNPYYQFFCGELSFCHRLPFDRSSLAHWRQRLGEEQLVALIEESLSVAHKTGALASRDLDRGPLVIVEPSRGEALQLADAAVNSGLKTATPPSGTPSSYAATMSSGIGAKSATRRKSRRDVPVEALSVLGAPRLLTTSSMLIVRKSMLQRTVFVVFGTVE